METSKIVAMSYKGPASYCRLLWVTMPAYALLPYMINQQKLICSEHPREGESSEQCEQSLFHSVVLVDSETFPVLA